MIDTHSPAGSWAHILPYCHNITILPEKSPHEVWLDAALARRKAMRPARSRAALKGWDTRRTK